MVEEHFGDKAYGFEVIYVSLLLLAVYAAVLALVARRKIPRSVSPMPCFASS